MFINVVSYVISDFNGVMAVLIRQSILARWRNISHAVGGSNKPPLSTSAREERWEKTCYRGSTNSFAMNVSMKLGNCSPVEDVLFKNFVCGSESETMRLEKICFIEQTQ